MPTKHRDLIVLSADGQSFVLGVHTLALVDVVHTIAVPHTAVACVSLYSVDGFACCVALYAFGSDLPAALVGDRLASFERQSFIVQQLLDGTDVNHCVGPLFLSLSVYTIPQITQLVKSFFTLLCLLCIVYMCVMCLLFLCISLSLCVCVSLVLASRLVAIV